MLQINEEALAWTCNDIQKFVRQFQILQKKLKNSDIKTSEKLKNIKEKLSTFEFEFKLDLLER